MASVEDLRTNQGEGLIDRCGSGHGLASDVGQHAFDHHKNQQSILDNEDSPTESNYPTRATVGIGMAIVQARPSGR
jgi:hypothetical protein